MSLTRISAAQGSVPASVLSDPQGENVSRSIQGSAVTLKVYSDGPAVSADALRHAIAAELGANVVLGEAETNAADGRAIVVAYDSIKSELAVSVRRAGHANTTRVVEAPAKPDEVITVAALLASNLLRDALAQSDDAAAEPSKPQVASDMRPSLPLQVPTDPPSVTAPPPEKAVAVASLFYPLATNFDKPGVHTHLSFNLLYGRIGAIDGFELGLVNTVSELVRGIELAGLANWVGGDFDGMQVGGAYNGAANVRGVRLTFGANHARGTCQGGQIAGIANITEGKVMGIHAALGLNWARGVEGVDIAGIANVSHGAFHGVEVAPFKGAQWRWKPKRPRSLQLGTARRRQR